MVKRQLKHGEFVKTADVRKVRRVEKPKKPPLRVVKSRGEERRVEPFEKLTKAEMVLLGLTEERRSNIRRKDDRLLYDKLQNSQTDSAQKTIKIMVFIFAIMAGLIALL